MSKDEQRQKPPTQSELRVAAFSEQGGITSGAASTATHGRVDLRPAYKAVANRNAFNELQTISVYPGPVQGPGPDASAHPVPDYILHAMDNSDSQKAMGIDKLNYHPQMRSNGENVQATEEQMGIKPQGPRISSYWSLPKSDDFPTLLAHFGTDWQGIANYMTFNCKVKVSLKF
jgi:hypothetical protein